MQESASQQIRKDAFSASESEFNITVEIHSKLTVLTPKSLAPQNKRSARLFNRFQWRLIAKALFMYLFPIPHLSYFVEFQIVNLTPESAASEQHTTQLA